MRLELKIAAGVITISALLLVAAAMAPTVASETTEAPQGLPVPACMPDPWRDLFGGQDLSAVVDDAYAHAPAGRVTTALSGGEQAGLAPPRLTLLPDSHCFSSSGLAPR